MEHLKLERIRMKRGREEGVIIIIKRAQQSKAFRGLSHVLRQCELRLPLDLSQAGASRGEITSRLRQQPECGSTAARRSGTPINSSPASPLTTVIIITAGIACCLGSSGRSGVDLHGEASSACVWSRLRRIYCRSSSAVRSCS